tara:strand:- start:468 stop:1265 length:798 start_codon:yes stop_codon:yes gene_type:complete
MKEVFSAVLITLCLFGCKDDSKEIYSQSAKDQSLAEVITMDVFEEVLTITPTYIIDGKYAADTNIIITSYPLLTDPSYPKTITIDYGNGVVGTDGKTRKGKIKILINSGTVLTEDLEIEFDDYVSEGNTVYGSVNYAYTNLNSTVSYDVTLNGTGLTFISANGTMKWDGDFLITRASGENTPSISDDIFKLSGSTTGVDFSGTSYAVKTETDHTIDFDCNEIITAGTSKITPNGKDEHDVDYGTGGCDANAVISLSSDNSQNFNF